MLTPEQIAEGLIWVDDAWDGHYCLSFGDLRGRRSTQKDALECCEQMRCILADAVRPLYEQARDAGDLLGIACHDEAGLVELGRREERGRVLGLIGNRQKKLDHTACGPDSACAQLAHLTADIRGQGPDYDPLPPAAAAARIARLETALTEIIRLAATVTTYPSLTCIRDAARRALEESP